MGYLGPIHSVKRVSDPIGGNGNFKVDGSDDSLLLRIFTADRSAEAVDVLHAIHRAVSNGGPFKGQYAAALHPLHPDGGPAVTEDGRIVTAYHYADEPDIRHYAGLSLKELETVARAYGQLHGVLQVLKGDNFLHQALDFGPLAGSLPWAKLDLELYHSVLGLVEGQHDWAYDVRLSVKLFLQYRELVDQAINAVIAMPPPVVTGEVVMHDLHPYNIFVVGDRCKLIYDYEAVSDRFSLSEALAFGLHRIVREAVRHDVTDVRQGIIRFLTMFENDGARVPKGFLSNLPSLIALPNLVKLILIMAQQLGLRQDDRGRTPAARHPELIKFLMHLQEAEYFVIG